MPMLLPQFRDAGDVQASIPSDWRGTLSVADAQCQTDPIPSSNQKTQHPKTDDHDTQTTQSDEQGTQVNLMSTGFVGDSAPLNSFLHESTSALEEQMLRNLTTSAFDGHTVSWEEEHDQVSCLHSLKHRGALAASAPEACSALAWNAGGTVLAAAYGPLDRTDWASQSSMLCTWSVFRRQLDPAKADLALELQDCLTCLAAGCKMAPWLAPRWRTPPHLASQRLEPLLRTLERSLGSLDSCLGRSDPASGRPHVEDLPLCVNAHVVPLGTDEDLPLVVPLRASSFLCECPP